MSDPLGICPAALVPEPLAATPPDLRAAVEAAGQAGFTQASVWSWHLPILAGGGSLADAARMLGDAGLEVTTVEGTMAWANGDTRAVDEEIGPLLEAAEATGARMFLAVCLEPEIADLDRARSNLGRVVETAERNGATVCVEFLPWTALPTLADAWRLIEPLGPAAGILIDAWHWQRQPGGPDLDLLGSIPPERVAVLQLSDAGPEAGADMMEETMTARLLPGAGVVDVGALLGRLGEMGAKPIANVEAFNPSLIADLGVSGAAQAMFRAATDVMQAASTTT